MHRIVHVAGAHDQSSPRMMRVLKDKVAYRPAMSVTLPTHRSNDADSRCCASDVLSFGLLAAAPRVGHTAVLHLEDCAGGECSGFCG